MGNESSPLHGIVVIDLTRVLSGPYCTMILADHGARVIKVEIPACGDDARSYGSSLRGKSAYFVSINRGKESIALNLKNPYDRDIFESILSDADVITENFRPGTMEKLGYGWEFLHKRYPKLIYGAVSGFGHTGPYSNRAAYDMVVQGMGGVMSVTGQPGGMPTRVGFSIGDLAAGLFLTIGISMALIKRQKTHIGSKVDIGMLDCQVALMEHFISRYIATEQITGPVGSYRPSIAPPFGMFHTKDEYIIITAGNDTLFCRLCEALGVPDLAKNDLYKTAEARIDNTDMLQEQIEQILVNKSSKEWCDYLIEYGIPCGPINTVDKVLVNPQVQARNMVVQVNDPDIGPYKIVGTPIKISDCPDPKTRPYAPNLDENRIRILQDFNIGEKNDSVT